MTADRVLLTFVTRRDCELCDAALARLEPAAGRLGVQIAVVDVADDSDLEAAYGEVVPVILDGNGAVLAQGQISSRQAWFAAVRARASRAG